jgi:hypothetical protein
MRATILALAAILSTASPAWAEEAPFGAVSSAPLPRGGLAIWGEAGYPGVRVGFREGYRSFEVGGEGGFDLGATTFFAALTGRTALYRSGSLSLSLDGKLGGFADAGSQWHDASNRAGAGLLFELGSRLSYKTGWPLSLLVFVRLPVEAPFTQGGSVKVVGLLGVGTEIAVGHDCFILFSGAVGPDLRSNVPVLARLAVEATAGFGYRVF